MIGMRLQTAPSGSEYCSIHHEKKRPQHGIQTASNHVAKLRQRPFVNWAVPRHWLPQPRRNDDHTSVLLPIRCCAVCCAPCHLPGQAQLEGNTNDNPFRQLYDVLPTPNTVRTASGAPGHAYWQQQVDYVMDIRLNDATQRIDGKETITYINNSPDELRYLWLQLDQNMRDLGQRQPHDQGGLHGRPHDL